MLASASPRKPSVRNSSRSFRSLSLLVAWRARASGNSWAGIPRPLSLTRISWRPPSATSTSIRVAPASREFSTSSFTTDAGRSTTSPAAICAVTSADKGRIGTASPHLASLRVDCTVRARPCQQFAEGARVPHQLARHGGGGGAVRMAAPPPRFPLARLSVVCIEGELVPERVPEDCKPTGARDLGLRHQGLAAVDLDALQIGVDIVAAEVDDHFALRPRLAGHAFTDGGEAAAGPARRLKHRVTVHSRRRRHL